MISTVLCGMARVWNIPLINLLGETIQPTMIIIVMPQNTRIPDALSTLPIVLLQEPSNLPKKRIDRLANLRNLYVKKIHNTTDVVVMVDFDIEFPNNSVQYLKSAIKKVHKDNWNVICANGLHVNKKNGKYFYYDGTATIFHNGAFAYPSIWQKHRQRNEYTTIRSTTEYFSNRSEAIIKVRSCFGGLAIYKSLAGCFYQTNLLKKKYKRYMYSFDGRVCEHIPFHDCLGKNRNGHFRIGVSRKLITNWNTN